MRNVVAALALLCAIQDTFAFNFVSTPLQQHAAPAAVQSRAAKFTAARANMRSVRAVPVGVMGLTAGVNAKMEYKKGRRPLGDKASSTKCACGSGMTYSRCCEKAHDDGEALDPLMLVKSRYSAYAYCLPEYIMATTQKKGPEWNAKTAEWEEDLLSFCDNYEFVDDKRKLGIVVEECKYQNDLLGNDDKATLLFKAMLLNKKDLEGKMVELWEKSSVVREGNLWVYRQGSLEEYNGPLN